MKCYSNKCSGFFNCSKEMKLIYTGLAIFLLTGYISIATTQFFLVGYSYDNIKTYYLGSDIEEEIAYPKTFPEMVQKTHFHAFTVGIVLLMLSHILVKSSLPAGIRQYLTCSLFASALIDLYSPWLIRYVSPLFSVLKLIAWPIFGISFLISIFAIFYGLWIPAQNSQKRDQEEHAYGMKLPLNSIPAEEKLLEKEQLPQMARAWSTAPNPPGTGPGRR